MRYSSKGESVGKKSRNSSESENFREIWEIPRNRRIFGKSRNPRDFEEIEKFFKNLRIFRESRNLRDFEKSEKFLEIGGFLENRGKSKETTRGVRW